MSLASGSEVSDYNEAPEIEDNLEGTPSEMSIEVEDMADETAEILELPAEIVSLCSLSPTTVVAGCMDDNAYVCEVDAEYRLQLLACLQGHSDTVVAISKNPKYSVFATSSYDGTVRIYSSETFVFIQTLEGPSSEIELIVWSPTGDQLLAGCSDGAVWLWQLAFSDSNEFYVADQKVLTGHNDIVTCGMFLSGSPARVLTASVDGHIIVWDLRTSKSIHRIRAPSTSPVVSLSVSKAGTIIAGCDSGYLFGVSAETGKALSQVQASRNAIECLAFNEAGTYLACGSTDGTLCIREFARLYASAPRHSLNVGAGISALTWHETENLVFVTTVSGTFAAYCPLTGNCVLKLEGGSEPLLAMSQGKLPNGQAAVFAGGDDANLRMFALQLEEETLEDELAKPAVP